MSSRIICPPTVQDNAKKVQIDGCTFTAINLGNVLSPFQNRLIQNFGGAFKYFVFVGSPGTIASIWVSLASGIFLPDLTKNFGAVANGFAVTAQVTLTTGSNAYFMATNDFDKAMTATPLLPNSSASGCSFAMRNPISQFYVHQQG